MFDYDSHTAFKKVDGGGLRMWAGFHGNSRDTLGQAYAAKNYVAASRLSGVGDNWLAYRYASAGWGYSQEQCPAVIIYGSSSSVRQGFSSAGGLDDRYSTGSHTGVSYIGICSCDPSGANELLTDCS